MPIYLLLQKTEVIQSPLMRKLVNYDASMTKNIIYQVKGIQEIQVIIFNKPGTENLQV